MVTSIGFWPVKFLRVGTVMLPLPSLLHSSGILPIFMPCHGRFNAWNEQSTTFLFCGRWLEEINAFHMIIYFIKTIRNLKLNNTYKVIHDLLRVTHFFILSLKYLYIHVLSQLRSTFNNYFFDGVLLIIIRAKLMLNYIFKFASH